MKYDKEIEYLISLAKTQGIATGSVSDGTVLILSENKLKDLLEQAKGKSYVMLLVQNQMNNNGTLN